jgi:hypothetical protein
MTAPAEAAARNQLRHKQAPDTRTWNLRPPFADNLSLRPNGGKLQKKFTAPLKPKMDFFIFPVPLRGGVPDA